MSALQIRVLGSLPWKKKNFLIPFSSTASLPLQPGTMLPVGPSCFGQNQNMLHKTSYGISIDGDACIQTHRQLAYAQGTLQTQFLEGKTKES